MKIEYEFMDGTVMEIKTDESQDAVMIGADGWRTALRGMSRT